MVKTDFFAFYGSLRRGMANYKIYQESLAYVETIRISGFKMYALEEYPYAVRSNEGTDSIVIEVFEITNTDTKSAIHELEISVGYVFDIIEINGRQVCIYLFENPGNDLAVNNGDWVEFFGVNDH
jgi:gamma-glutamylcyclotransferase (GGCT)/AIG2-like uncharacterized protein YtfP